MSSDLLHIHEFIRHLLSATANAALYGMLHPQVIRLSALAYTTVTTMFESRKELTLLVVENNLVIDGHPQTLSLFLERFTRILKSRDIGIIKLLSGVTKNEIDILIGVLAHKLSDTALTDAGSESIHIGTIDLVVTGQGGLESGGEKGNRVSLHEMPQQELLLFSGLHVSMTTTRKIKIKTVFELVSRFVRLLREDSTAVLAMATQNDATEVTFTHSGKVCVLNLAQAMALDIDGPLLLDIGVASLMHDIGKLSVPEEILTKTVPLTSEEVAHMQQHPVTGARLLLDTPDAPRLAAVVAYEHHLNYNLSGYPAVPPEWQQNICSHMTKISDFFDALCMPQGERKPLSFPEVCKIMQSRKGIELHPSLTDNFLKVISVVSKTTH